MGGDVAVRLRCRPISYANGGASFSALEYDVGALRQLKREREREGATKVEPEPEPELSQEDGVVEVIVPGEHVEA